ncbi:hypothetical protein ACMZ5A_27930 [Bacillus mobilis]|uniref:hypothetical protein n=1 Tax=Bacillus mobilis TaxID=2026190 RepID=UPI0035DA00E7
MLKIKEEDLGLFKIVNKNRLSPDYIRIFYGGVLGGGIGLISMLLLYFMFIRKSKKG